MPFAAALLALMERSYLAATSCEIHSENKNAEGAAAPNRSAGRVAGLVLLQEVAEHVVELGRISVGSLRLEPFGVLWV